MTRGSNLSRLGSFNQTVLFDAIRRARGGISRVELVTETGLTAQINAAAQPERGRAVA